jgi:hypothetical protein
VVQVGMDGMDAVVVEEAEDPLLLSLVMVVMD